MKNSILFLSGVVALFLLSSCIKDKDPDNKTPNKEIPNISPEVPFSGSAVISSYDCTSPPVGTLVSGILTTGVTKTIKATVTTKGTYDISTTTVNGIRFIGKGTFTATGVQDVILTASGTPTGIGEYEFILGTPPLNCSFKMTINKNPSSNGTAVVSSYDCTTAESTGKLVVGVVATDVTQTITAVVIIDGSYDISTTATNGIRFAAKGAFTGIGNQTIELIAIGTPEEAGNPSFALLDLPATTTSCSFLREIKAVAVDPGVLSTDGVPAICDGTAKTEVVEVTAKSGRIWMDRNLGANRAATSKDDYQAYGCLFQWGRGNDGHASINWISSTNGQAINGTTTTLSSGDTPGDSKFITPGNGSNDWHSPQNNDLWQEDTEINNPCPAGYRIPTDEEFLDIIKKDGLDNGKIEDMDSAYKSKFKFVAAGSRNTNGSFDEVGNRGRYWTSSYPESEPPKPPTNSMISYYFNACCSGPTKNNFRAAGLSVRCTKK